MLFNSYIFVLAFLPVVYLVARFLAPRVSLPIYLSWLVLASIVFYGWQDPALGVLFVASILFNYVIAARLVSAARAAGVRASRSARAGAAVTCPPPRRQTRPAHRG